MKQIIPMILVCIAFVACGHRETYDPYKIASQNDSISAANSDCFEIDFKKTSSDIKTIHVKLNDAVSYDAIFDTGCSGVLISQLEFVNLLKAGTISSSDRLEKAYSTYADGSTVENIRYNIHEIAVTDKNGHSHILRDIAATIVENPEAEILIGTAVIDNLATHSYTVDLDNNVIRFQ